MNLTKNQIEIMLTMQSEMNTLIGPNWREKKHPYLRAAMIEAVEAMNYLGWEWWKATKEDIKQAQIEMVDVWHFALSYYLTDLSTSDDFLFNEINYKSYLEDYVGGYSFADVFLEPEDYEISKIGTVVDKLQLFAAMCGVKYFEIHLFLSIIEDLGMTQQDLFNMYIAKNVLNEFRQKNGYKEGFYVKNWNGREDNQHLTEFMNGVDSSEPNYADLLRGMLQERYKTVVKDVDECYVTRGKS